MRILHIIPSLSKGGAERLVIDIVKKLKHQDHIQVHLVIFRKDINHNISEIKNRISIIPSSVKLSLTKKWKINVTELQLFINDFKPDIIHSHLFEAELVSRFCNYKNARWYSHLHDNMVQLERLSWHSISKKNLTNFFEKLILFLRYKKNGGTNFIAISKHTESYIKSIQSRYPVHLLHNAIDFYRFKKPLKYSKIKKIGNLSSIEYQPIKLINIGSFVTKKNQSLVLEIIIELNKKGFKTYCLFLGDGELKNELERRSIELKISDQCNFLGNVENVEEYLWQSEVYLHTATYEPFGLVLLEAMAAGLPVVTLDGGGNRDLMINGENGYLIEEQNPKKFSKRILQLYQNKEISNYNVKFAGQFDIQSYCSKLLKIYKNQN